MLDRLHPVTSMCELQSSCHICSLHLAFFEPGLTHRMFTSPESAAAKGWTQSAASLLKVGIDIALYLLSVALAQTHSGDNRDPSHL
jgi:hypothetical protein